MFKSLGIAALVAYLIIASQLGGFSPGLPIVFLSILSVVAGLLAVMGLTAPTDLTRGAFKQIQKPLPMTHEALMQELQEIATITRRDGLLALEAKRKELKEPLLKLLLKRIVEGFDKAQTLPLLRNQAVRQAELIRACEIYSERVQALIPTIGLIPSLFILVDFLAHPEKVPNPGSLPTLFFPFIFALFLQMLATSWSGKFFDEIKETVKLYYVLMEEGVASIQDGGNAEVLRDRLQARFRDNPVWNE